MGAITSSTFDTRSGSGTITIDPDNDTALPATSSIVSDLTAVEADYDIEDDEEQASAIFLDLGEITVKFWDELGNNTSLFDEIDKIDSTTDIDLEFSFTFDAGRSFTERYQFRAKDVEYDRIRRETTIKARPKPLDDPTVEQIFTNNPSDVYTIDFYGGVEDCMPLSKYIENTIANLNSNNTNIVDSVIFDSIAQTDGESSYVILRRANGADSNPKLFKYAAAEGSVIGSLMGYNFFVNRLSTGQQATISQSDVESLNAKIGLNSYLTIRNTLKLGITQPIGYYSFGYLLGDADGLNDDAKKRLDITFNEGVTEFVTWDAANSEYAGFSSPPNGADQTENTTDGEQQQGTTGITVTTGSGATIAAGDVITFGTPSDFTDKVLPFYVADSAVSSGQFTIKTPLRESVSGGVDIWRVNDVGVNEIAEQGDDSYAKAFSATGARELKLTIFGVDTVKPYESILFDSSFDAPLDGSTYRPSSLKYDFVNDRIEVEAYQIA